MPAGAPGDVDRGDERSHEPQAEPAVFPPRRRRPLSRCRRRPPRRESFESRRGRRRPSSGRLDCVLDARSRMPPRWRGRRPPPRSARAARRPATSASRRARDPWSRGPPRAVVERPRCDGQDSRREERDVVLALSAPDDLRRGCARAVGPDPSAPSRRARRASAALVDRSAATLDQPVRVEDDDAPGRELDHLLPVRRASPVPSGRPRAALDQLDPPVGIGDDRRRMAG